MEIKKTTKTKNHYEIKCPWCEKVVSGSTVKAVRHNFRMHEATSVECLKARGKK